MPLAFLAGQSRNTVEYAAGPRKAGRFIQTAFSAGQSCNTIEHAARPRKAGRFNQTGFSFLAFFSGFLKAISSPGGCWDDGPDIDVCGGANLVAAR
jgi:hypothetical protein